MTKYCTTIVKDCQKDYVIMNDNPNHLEDYGNLHFHNNSNNDDKNDNNNNEDQAAKSTMSDSKSEPTRRKSSAASSGIKYIKARQAPRRFKSAYMFYSIEKHKEIRNRLKDEGIHDAINSREISKMVAQEWKGLDPSERQVYDLKSRQDHQRFEKEKKDYAGPWKMISPKIPKKLPAGAPRRPSSAFFSFCSDVRPMVSRRHLHMNSRQVSHIISQEWHAGPEWIRTAYRQEEQLARQVHALQYWKWQLQTEIEEASNETARGKDIPVGTSTSAIAPTEQKPAENAIAVGSIPGVENTLIQQLPQEQQPKCILPFLEPLQGRLMTQEEWQTQQESRK